MRTASSDFYLTFPSNASMELHPNNTSTHYVTALTQRISMSGQLECGLVEIQHPHSWYNVREEDAWFGLARTDVHVINAKCRIELCYYNGPDKLIRMINNTLAGMIVKKK